MVLPHTTRTIFSLRKQSLPKREQVGTILSASSYHDGLDGRLIFEEVPHGIDRSDQSAVLR